jgi:hypothetical protein
MLWRRLTFYKIAVFASSLSLQCVTNIVCQKKKKNNLKQNLVNSATRSSSTSYQRQHRMFFFVMPEEMMRIRKFPVAQGARIWSLTGMRAHVPPQTARLVKALLAGAASVWFDRVMNPHVVF